MTELNIVNIIIQTTKNVILTEEELTKATDNDEERTTAVNSEITHAKYSDQVMDAKDALKRPSKLIDAFK